MIFSFEVDRINYGDGIRSKFNKYKKHYKKEEPFFCKKCSKVWQPMREDRKLSDYIVGFPKYGCTDRICTNCEKKL